jgi:phospholipid/cholesterol/gamma-HCH transport system substrate-binding protein
MERKSVDVMVGLFVLLGIGALIFLAFRAANLSSFSTGDSYAVTARFDNIGGLKVRAPVKSAGVVVGRVASIGFDPVKFQALVTMNLDQRYKFPKDSSAKILTSGLLGEQYLGLEAGAEMDNLIAGNSIKLTSSAVVLENLISQFIYGRADEAKSGATKEGSK